MNRIICFLDAPEVRRKRAVAAAYQCCEDIEARCRGLVQFAVDIDGTAVLIVHDPLERDAVADLGEFEAHTAAELRKFAGQCLEVAADLEGGAV